MASPVIPVDVEKQTAPPAVTPNQDPTSDAPQTQTPEEIMAQQKLDEACKCALLELRKTFKMRYQPKRMRYVSEAMRAFEALRGNTYALLNDQSAALDTINQLMQGYLGQGDDPQLYAHNDNIYQAFGMIFIAALMVDLGKVRYQPGNAQDDVDLAIARKASIIQAYNERKNDSTSLMQLKLLYLWTTGSFFRYVRHVIDKKRAGTTPVPQIEMVPTKLMPDGYLCPKCGYFVPDSKASMFSSAARCPKCGATLTQKDWFEGPEVDMPTQVGETLQPNGMTACDVVCGLCVDANPDALWLKDTEILDYSIECAPGKVRAAYPSMYTQIVPNVGSDASSDGDAARMARAGTTTPGSNNRPITAIGVGTYSRCWFQPEAFSELEDQTIAVELLKRYPDGCKLVLWGSDVVLDVQPEALLDHWTWCGTVKGIGLYPFAVGKVVMDIQERVTGAVNKIDAYMDRVAFGTMLYDADYIDGNAMANKVLTPGNLTPVSRTDEETGRSVPLDQCFHQMTFQIDPEIYKYPDSLTARAQFLCGVMPQVFGGSDPSVETARGQAQALSSALGRLKQYIQQMRTEDADWAQIGIKCTIDNMDDELKIVAEGDTKGSWQTISMLKSELTGELYTYPETDEGFPATYEEVQSRFMTLLGQMGKTPYLGQFLGDPDLKALILHYILPPGTKLPGENERAKIKTILHNLSQDKNGPVVQPNPANPAGPPVVIPSILPEPAVDDPAVCQAEAKTWLLDNWEQEQTNPKGYGNVLAYLTVSAQMAKEQAAEQAINMQQQVAAKAPPRGQRQL